VDTLCREDANDQEIIGWRCVLGSSLAMLNGRLVYRNDNARTARI